MNCGMIIMVTETELTDIHEAEAASHKQPVEEKIPRGLAAAIKKAKRASDAQNEQSRRISEELRQERERDVVAPKVLHGQMTFSDFR
jgi:transcriptional regulator NrdR family protein